MSNTLNFPNRYLGKLISFFSKSKNFSDACDNCPKIPNRDQADDDEDTLGNVCDNNDDSDRDGIPDISDNCISDPNADQLDTDSDGMGDECDPDADNDKLLNEQDNCMLVFNPDQQASTIGLYNG